MVCFPVLPKKNLSTLINCFYYFISLLYFLVFSLHLPWISLAENESIAFWEWRLCCCLFLLDILVATFNFVLTFQQVMTLKLNSKRKSRMAKELTRAALYRSSRPEVFCTNSVLKKIACFTRTHLSQILFFNKSAYLGPATLLKRDSSTVAFLWILWKF